MATLSIAGDRYMRGLKIGCKLYQGVATRVDVKRKDGDITKGVTFSAGISKGDVVNIWTGSWADSDIIVEKCVGDSVDPTTSGRHGAIGIVVDTPEGEIPEPSSNLGTHTASSTDDLQRATVVWPDFNVVVRGEVLDASQAGMAVGWDQSGTEFTTASGTVAWRPYMLVQSSSANGTFSVFM